MSEKASKLSPAMLRGLQLAADSPGLPVRILPATVAKALMIRGFIIAQHPRPHVTYGQLWFITPRGRTALRISKKENQ